MICLKKKEELAVFGGEPVIKPKKLEKKYSQKMIDEVYKYLKNDGPISIAEREGVVFELEEMFAKKYGHTYSVALNSGSNCIFAALFAIGIKKGDEVVAPTYGFHACISSIFHTGGKPVFCDCEENNVNMSPEKFEKLITPKTKAVVVVHNWGCSADIEKIVNIAHKYGIYVIEDCSHAHGSEYKGATVGRFGDVAVFSLQANKTVYAGEGGILLTSNKDIFERVILIGRYRGKRYLSDLDFDDLLETGYGLKFRIHPLGAVIAIHTFKHMDEIIEKRNKSVKEMLPALERSSFLKPPVIPDYVTRHSYYGYKPTFVKKNEEYNNFYIKALQAEGVDIHRTSYIVNTRLKLFEEIKKENIYGEENAINLNNRMVSLSIPQSEDYENQARLYAEAFNKVELCKDKIISYIEKNQ